MRQVVFLLSLIAFLAASWADIAHAAVDKYACTHDSEVVISADFSGDNCQPGKIPSNKNISDCHDCCCLHVHVLAASAGDLQTPHLNGQRIGLLPDTAPRSNHLYSLYKPPRS